ncbi:hypothetical protein QR680_005928 [Steinernema hermaphroditum]|uniref:Uncharacterized protein n=1 Tax=Steinernema hermaphroditum TaxID=289476 RepID=A0AA39LWJ9_9BILA|nr:hypothetical protein QR680_005928 [Steinernema hermaphroditum]
MGSYNEESMPNCSRALEEFGVGSGLSQGDSRRAGSEGVPLVNSEGGVVCADRCLKATEHGAKFRVDEGREAIEQTRIGDCPHMFTRFRLNTSPSTFPSQTRPSLRQ